MDEERILRETARWYILVCVNAGRPHPVAEPLILSTLQGIPLQVSARDLRRELDYLEDRGLLTLARNEAAPWSAEITRDGVDLVEYTTPLQPGIARPKKYWHD